MLLAHSVQYWQVELVETGQQVQMTEALLASPQLEYKMQPSQPLQGAVSGRHVQASQWKRQGAVIGGRGKCKASGGNAVSGESHAVLSLTLASSLSLPCSDSVIYTFGASLFKNCSDSLIHTFGAKMLHYVKTQAASQTRVL